MFNLDWTTLAMIGTVVVSLGLVIMFRRANSYTRATDMLKIKEEK